MQIDPAVELVAAMAEVRRRLILREWELREKFSEIEHTSSSVTASHQHRDNAPEFLRADPRAYFGPGIEVFLSARFKDGSWVEWFGWAINRLNAGWTVEREVSLDVPDGRPEVNRVAGSALQEITIADSLTLARAFVTLVDELVALPLPQRPAS